MPDEMARWSATQVLALAPDASAQKAGQGLATAGPWRDTGCTAAAVWGFCQGSGRNPYQTCVDLTEPAYRCSCPSRKFPCKHALGLLLLWSAGGVPAGEPPAWVTEWLESRSERQTKASERAEARASRPTDPAVAAATRARRAQRVDAGIAELERWLTDQVRQGLAGATRAGYAHWDTMAARLVDAQAPTAAATVRRLAAVASEPDRLLTELGQLWLLVRAYQRLDDLPEPLAATVRSRIGFPVATEDVLASPRVRDLWEVVGQRDDVDERLTVRRVWLRGVHSGRPALVLTFAPAGQSLPTDLLLGTCLDADLCFYPGAQPLRALIAHRHSAPTPTGTPEGAADIASALDEYATAVAAEPWLDRWPIVLRDVVPVRTKQQWVLRDRTSSAMPLDLPSPWRLVAAAGGHPCTIAGEWSSRGLRPLTVWTPDEVVAL